MCYKRTRRIISNQKDPAYSAIDNPHYLYRGHVELDIQFPRAPPTVADGRNDFIPRRRVQNYIRLHQGTNNVIFPRFPSSGHFKSFYPPPLNPHLRQNEQIYYSCRFILPNKGRDRRGLKDRNTQCYFLKIVPAVKNYGSSTRALTILL